MLEQLKGINPSARDPLFRRVMSDEKLAYLRDKNSIVGFELDTSVDQELSGFTLIAIQKHTIYAYRSDLHETPRLVLFPPLDKLFDTDFEMLDLRVIKKSFHDASFNGRTIATGRFDTLVKDLTPPEKEVDIPAGVSEKMVEHMRNIEHNKIEPKPIPLRSPLPQQDPELLAEMEALPPEAPMDDLNRFDDGGYDHFDDMNHFEDGGYDDGGYGGYDEFGGYDDTLEPIVETTKEPEEDARSIELKAQTFTKFTEVSDYAVLRLNVPKAVATQVANKVLQSGIAEGERINLTIRLFVKLFNEKKI